MAAHRGVCQEATDYRKTLAKIEGALLSGWWDNFKQ